MPRRAFPFQSIPPFLLSRLFDNDAFSPRPAKPRTLFPPPASQIQPSLLHRAPSVFPQNRPIFRPAPHACHIAARGVLIDRSRPFPGLDRQGGAMGPRPTKTKKGASVRCRGIDNWDRAFNSVHIDRSRPFQSPDRQGGVMDPRPTKTNKRASVRCRAFDTSDRAFNSVLIDRSRPFPSPDRQGGVIGPRPTKTNKGASVRCRGIGNWDRAFNRVFSVRIPETGKRPSRRNARIASGSLVVRCPRVHDFFRFRKVVRSSGR